MVGTKGHTGTYEHKPLSQKTKDKIRESCRDCPIIHHINGNHLDNRKENRMIVTPKEHAIIHILQGDIKPYGGGLPKGYKFKTNVRGIKNEIKNIRN